MSSLKVALLQYTARASEENSKKTIMPMMTTAAAKGARLIALPECATRLDPDRKRLAATADRQEDSAILAEFCDFARLHKVWVSIGSMVLKPDDGDDTRLVNRSLMINPDGQITATYDKIHMFDVVINADEKYQESAHYQPGSKAVVTPVDDALFGMSICYDLRFPHVYNALAQAGAGVMIVPSAFTVATGKAHWEVLLRARAIETGSFVLAAAQTGTHEPGNDGTVRRTYGHSMIISPWGDVKNKLGTEAGICDAELNLNSIQHARKRLPVLEQQRPFTMNTIMRNDA